VALWNQASISNGFRDSLSMREIAPRFWHQSRPDISNQLLCTGRTAPYIIVMSLSAAASAADVSSWQRVKRCRCRLDMFAHAHSRRVCWWLQLYKAEVRRCTDYKPKRSQNYNSFYHMN